MMRLLTTLFIVCLLLSANCYAQNTGQGGDVWSLERCVRFAVDHNISIKQDSLNARLARYTLQQSQLSQLPNFSANGSYGRSYGRSIKDPYYDQKLGKTSLRESYTLYTPAM